MSAGFGLYYSVLDFYKRAVRSQDIDASLLGRLAWIVYSEVAPGGVLVHCVAHLQGRQLTPFVLGPE